MKKAQIVVHIPGEASSPKISQPEEFKKNTTLYPKGSPLLRLSSP